MPSLEDVAKRAGVSIATVSRVINRSDKVVSSTAAQVRSVMAELGFQPSRVARRLRQKGGKRNLLGLIIPDIQNPFYAEIARGVEDAAYAGEFAVMLCNSDESEEKESFYLEVMRAESVDGIILPPISDRDQAVVKVARSGLPLVCVDRSLVGHATDRVEVDNRQGAFEAVEHLVSLGHRRIGFIAGPPGVSTARDRRRGYVDALDIFGIGMRDELIRVGDNRQASGATMAHELLSMSAPPTALFASNNLMAVGALEAIHRRGLRVPGDVALIGFDDLPWAEALDPPLTVVRQPAHEVGKRAVELLLKRLEDPGRPAESVVLKPSLVLRRSC